MEHAPHKLTDAECAELMLHLDVLVQSYQGEAEALERQLGSYVRTRLQLAELGV